MKDLGGKAVLVTGAASGIGRGAALAFAREGAGPLIITDINASGLAETATMIESLGKEVLPFPADITDYPAVKDLVDRALEKTGRIDVLVNVAGIGILSPYEDLELADWKQVLDINLWGILHTIHAVYPHMMDRKSGHIVNVSSSDGLYISWIYSAPYCASKFAVVGLTEELLYEAAFHGIGVTCFCPGAVRTSIFDTSPVKGFREELRRLQGKMLRFADSPEDVGRWIVDAVKKNRFLVLTTMEYKIYYFLRKYLPFIWFPYMRLQARLFARMLRKYRA